MTQPLRGTPHGQEAPTSTPAGDCTLLLVKLEATSIIRAHARLRGSPRCARHNYAATDDDASRGLNEKRSRSFSMCRRNSGTKLELPQQR